MKTWIRFYQLNTTGTGLAPICGGDAYSRVDGRRKDHYSEAIACAGFRGLDRAVAFTVLRGMNLLDATESIPRYIKNVSLRAIP